MKMETKLNENLRRENEFLRQENERLRQENAKLRKSRRLARWLSFILGVVVFLETFAGISCIYGLSLPSWSSWPPCFVKVGEIESELDRFEWKIAGEGTDETKLAKDCEEKQIYCMNADGVSAEDLQGWFREGEGTFCVLSATPLEKLEGWEALRGVDPVRFHECVEKFVKCQEYFPLEMRLPEATLTRLGVMELNSGSIAYAKFFLDRKTNDTGTCLTDLEIWNRMEKCRQKFWEDWERKMKDVKGDPDGQNFDKLERWLEVEPEKRAVAEWILAFEALKQVEP